MSTGRAHVHALASLSIVCVLTTLSTAGTLTISNRNGSSVRHSKELILPDTIKSIQEKNKIRTSNGNSYTVASYHLVSDETDTNSDKSIIIGSRYDDSSDDTRSNNKTDMKVQKQFKPEKEYQQHLTTSSLETRINSDNQPALYVSYYPQNIKNKQNRHRNSEISAQDRFHPTTNEESGQQFQSTADNLEYSFQESNHNYEIIPSVEIVPSGNGQDPLQDSYLQASDNQDSYSQGLDFANIQTDTPINLEDAAKNQQPPPGINQLPPAEEDEGIPPPPLPNPPSLSNGGDEYKPKPSTLLKGYENVPPSQTTTKGYDYKPSLSYPSDIIDIEPPPTHQSLGYNYKIPLQAPSTGYEYKPAPPPHNVGYEYKPPPLPSDGYEYKIPPTSIGGYDYKPPKPPSVEYKPEPPPHNVGYDYKPPPLPSDGYEYKIPPPSIGGYDYKPPKPPSVEYKPAPPPHNVGYDYKPPPLPSDGYDYKPPPLLYPPSPKPTEGYFYLPPPKQYLPVPPPKLYLPVPPPKQYLPSPPPLTPEPPDYATYNLGIKMWYLPLFFSAYFAIYVIWLIAVALLRHRVSFITNLYSAANGVFSAQRKNSEDNLNQLFNVVASAIKTANKKYS